MRAILCFSLFVSVTLTARQAAPPQTPAPPAPSERQRVEGFRVEETTIAQIHDAMKSGRVTCRQLVDAYLRRIDAYDKNGPALNALVVVNPDAQKQADDMDRRYAQSGLTGPLHGVENGPDTPACKAEVDYRERFRAAVAKTMDAQELDAFVYPTWSNPPRLIGDLNTPHGDNSQVFSPTTGWPAINVPMGYTRGTLPAGITFFGRAWSETTVIKFAYAYEQATRHRHAPASTPPLR